MTLFETWKGIRMKSDPELKRDAMTLLRVNLGLVESERFLALMQREPFDYTEWRRSSREQATVSELVMRARQLRSTPDP